MVESGAITRAGLAWFGMGPTPIAMTQLENALVGKAVDSLAPQALAEIAVRDAAPFDDHHASAEYRRTIGRRIFAKTLRETIALEVPA